MVKAEKMEKVKDRATELANERLVSLLVPAASKPKNFKNPLEMLFGNQGNQEPEEEEPNDQLQTKRRQIKHQLRLGELEDWQVEIEVEDHSPNMFDMLSSGNDQMMGMNMQDMLSSFMPKKKKRRKLPVREARKVLTQEEAQKLIDMDEVIQLSIERAEQLGIIFIDEIDKIASGGGRSGGPDVSREGVQRDILPIVEGSTVMTKYGPVKTDYVLFVAAGAFHIAKPSDLIPELQGRFPIRVELDNLTMDDFVRILTEPRNALIKQYTALLETEGIHVKFSDEAVREIARMASEVNQNTDNIGARRLHTILERLLEDLSFEAPDINLEEILITPEYVRDKLSDITQNRDLSQYIL